MFKMVRSLIVLTIITILSPVNLSAEGFTIYNDLGVEFESGDEICANRSYFVENDGSYKEVLVLDQNTKQILDVINSNSSEFEIVFPENASDLTIMVTPYTATNQLNNDERVVTDISVTPCDYEVISEDYQYLDFDFSVSLDGNNLIIKKTSTDSDFILEYQFLDSLNTESYDFSDGDLVIDITGHDVVQVLETSNAEDYNKEDDLYLEIEVAADGNFFIREVSQFEIIGFQKLDLVDFRLLALSALFLVLIIYLTILYKRVKKQYKEEKINHLRKK